MEENKLELKEAWLDKKNWFLDKYSCRGTRIAPCIANMEKGLTYIYCLGPPLEGQKTTIGHQADSLGELVDS